MAGGSLEVIVGDLLRAQGLTLGLAESSTGGLIGHRLTEVPGSSAYFRGGIVAYARDVQEDLLGVAPTTIEAHGIVSAEVAREMARNIRRRLNADIGLSVTGIAGPTTGRRSTKPGGLTYIGLAADDIATHERHVFAGHRSQNKQQSAEAALGLLRRYLDRRVELPQLQQMVAGIDSAGAPRIARVRVAPAGIRQTDISRAQSLAGQRLGVFSSAFNPLTMAHVRIVELARQQYGLDEVALELSKVNVDKGLFGASLAERLWVLRRFVDSRPRYSVMLGSHARFIDKAIAIRAAYPESTQLFFILGYDTLVRLFDPRYYADMDTELRELFDLSEFIVVNRGEHHLDAVRSFLKRPICQPYASRIHLLALDRFHAGLSSTHVRERIRRGESVADIVPAEVVPLLPLTGLVG